MTIMESGVVAGRSAARQSKLALMRL